MIRFCDSEVCCIEYDELNRNTILNYFFQGHMDDIVCVVDANGMYKGKIVYYTLIGANDVFDSIEKDSVVLDQNVWQNARYYFSHYERKINESVLLPVLDNQGKLLCFAYEDNDANREIRFLRELSEASEALQFVDIYPEYECVKIYELNELAYFFVQYLRNQNIEVHVYGELWRWLDDEIVCLEDEKKCMTIYAEGINIRSSNWIDNLLRSVSVEFECIDHIYETNIKNGVFQDAAGGGITDLLSCLSKKKEIILLGSGRETQDVYNFLMKNHIDICSFVSENYSERTHKMFGKEILSFMEVRKRYKNPVFIECSNKHSAGGFGGTDYYDYIGYKRNVAFYLIRDYIDINSSNLINILKNKNVFLAGEFNLCVYLNDFFEQEKCPMAGYLNISNEWKIEDSGRLPLINPENIVKDSVCLIVLPEYNEPNEEQKLKEEKRQLKKLLKEMQLDDYTEYFSYTFSFAHIQEFDFIKYTKRQLHPKKIVIGSIESHSGNAFFRGLIDNHPSIIMLNYCKLNNHLFWICICLSVKKAQEIMPTFWQMFDQEEYSKSFCNPSAFNEKMEQLLTLAEHFTSQELFVMIHIAFMYMYGINISSDNINEFIIYWEPHHVHRVDTEEFTKWLGTNDVRCDIVNVVRNICMRNAGEIKNALLYRKDKSTVFHSALQYPSLEKINNKYGDRLIVKFEDLKCYPRTTLMEICDRWNIAWSDSLMETTKNGERISYNNGVHMISDFDMEPVYNTNEQFLSEFDRFRMNLINMPYQKKYGYPYIPISQFTRRELQEMFLNKYRFEDWIEYPSVKLGREYKIRIYEFIRYNLQKVRMIEIYSNL